MRKFDANLIHVAPGGVLVRSKNEVIVASILQSVAPDRWSYERPLSIDGVTKYPDFMIEWDCYNHRRPHEYCDDLTPVQAHYAHHGPQRALESQPEGLRAVQSAGTRSLTDVCNTKGDDLPELLSASSHVELAP